MTDILPKFFGKSRVDIKAHSSKNEIKQLQGTYVYLCLSTTFPLLYSKFISKLSLSLIVLVVNWEGECTEKHRSFT